MPTADARRTSRCKQSPSASKACPKASRKDKRSPRSSRPPSRWAFPRGCATLSTSCSPSANRRIGSPAARPIVWPSNRKLETTLGLGRRQVQNVLNALIRANLITPVDSPTGRRWGHRDARTGKIVEAYGFDLSPIALRHAEFVALAARAAAEERERAALRRRLTIARKAIQQIAETALEHQLTDRDWHYWLAEALTLVLTIPNDVLLDQLQAVVAELEQRRAEGEATLRAAFDSVQNASAGAIECTPITTTTQPEADNSATGKINSEQSRSGQGDSPTSSDPVCPEQSIASCRHAKVRPHRLPRAEALPLHAFAQLGRHR